MGRASQATKLPLATWAKIMGLNPLHFEGVQTSAFKCRSSWVQYAWQNADAPSREDVASAIAEAEANIERALGWRLTPTWEVDEWQAPRRYYQPNLLAPVTDVRGFGDFVETKWKKFLSGGVRSQDLVQDNVLISWSDTDNDDYFETATVTCPTTALNACELHVFYPQHNGDRRWEIRPVQVVIAGGVATITFRRELCVLEELLEEMTDNDEIPFADGYIDANFLTHVDVYRIYNDPQRQAQLLWEPYSSCDTCNGNGCALCAYSTQWACLHARGRREHGMVVYTPATWNPATLTFDQKSWAAPRRPDAIRLWYYSGLESQDVDCANVEMDPQWARVVAHYAAAILDRPPCTCNTAHFEYWQTDLATGGESRQYKFKGLSLESPFGSRLGAAAAWKQIETFGEQSLNVTLV